MANFKDPYRTYFNNGAKYEFILEVVPNIWKISRRTDRMEYLAEDVTDTLFVNADSDPRQLTDSGRLMRLEGHNMFQRVEQVLNHPNLVCLVDVFAMQFSNSGKLGRARWFTVWDYCDAGNLGNLLVPSQPRPQEPEVMDRVRQQVARDIRQVRQGADDVEMEEAPPEDAKPPTFLPESLCWHVLTSVLRALAWLHDGVKEVHRRPNAMWQRSREDLDWQPMLHRDIRPENIFLSHPRRAEWYGPVKLGNYGTLFVSGHCQTPGDQHAPVYSKVISPPVPEAFGGLENLIALDTMYGSVYPFQAGQPYTMVSEYRALGEIIQAMMVEPSTSNHMGMIQSHPVTENLENVGYTGRLKNFLVKMMQFDPWEKTGETDERNPSYVTSNLYGEAVEGFEWFRRNGSAEANTYVTPKMAEDEDRLEYSTVKTAAMLNSYRNVADVLEQFP